MVTFNRVISLIGAVLIASIFIMARATPAEADDYPPIDGCQEAVEYPHSDGADACRAHGWTITRHIAVTPYGYVARYRRLPMCANEDGSDSINPCRWNFGYGQSGNGLGKAYWISVKGKVHYVKGMATEDES